MMTMMMIVSNTPPLVTYVVAKAIIG